MSSPTWQLVLTLLDEDDKRDQVVGQVLINLMQENLWKSGGTFTTKLREVKVPIRDHAGSIERVDYDSLPCQVQTHCKSHYTCELILEGESLGM
jgi:hypothetical protein